MPVKSAANWTTPRELREQVERLWSSGRLLGCVLAKEELFPLTLRVRRPRRSEFGRRFEEIRDWMEALESHGRARRGWGYEIEWVRAAHRQLGENRFPGAVRVPSRQDALRLIGKTREAERFDELAQMTLARFPLLERWLVRHPLTVMKNERNWERILDVLGWFRENPHSGLYLRQVDIEGVDSKFIEAGKGLFRQLLDLVLSLPKSEGKESGGNRERPPGFEQRYGLLSRPRQIRFRILDDRQAICGLTDIVAPIEQFKALAPPARRVFITENIINGVAFPKLPDALVIFGLGYGLDLLFQLDWLAERELYYWGDIDTHGFAMLNQLRRGFPHARSILMDRKTLLAYPHLWVEEKTPQSATLSRLHSDERELYEDIVFNRHGARVRLEQERIPYQALKQTLKQTCVT